MKRIDRYLSSKLKVIIFAVIFVLFMIIVLPKMAQLTTDTIGISESPDTSLSLDKDGFYELLDNYGKEGRAFYIKVRWTFDVVWPVVYGLFLVSSMAFLSIGIKQRKILVLLPVLAVIFDFLENIFATITMYIYPTTYDLLFYLLKLSSLIKWGTLSIAFVCLIILVFRRILMYFKR